MLFVSPLATLLLLQKLLISFLLLFSPFGVILLFGSSSLSLLVVINLSFEIVLEMLFLSEFQFIKRLESLLVQLLESSVVLLLLEFAVGFLSLAAVLLLDGSIKVGQVISLDLFFPL